MMASQLQMGVAMSHIIKEASGGRVEPEILLCHEKRHLLEAFTEAVHEIMLLQKQQVADIINDDDFTRFDLVLHLANERRELAKYAYLQHVEEHGC
jgi:hypothetical protein